jgi:hypothetical protein
VVPGETGPGLSPRPTMQAFSQFGRCSRPARIGLVQDRSAREREHPSGEEGRGPSGATGSRLTHGSTGRLIQVMNWRTLRGTDGSTCRRDPTRGHLRGGPGHDGSGLFGTRIGRYSPRHAERACVPHRISRPCAATGGATAARGSDARHGGGGPPRSRSIHRTPIACDARLPRVCRTNRQPLLSARRGTTPRMLHGTDWRTTSASTSPPSGNRARERRDDEPHDPYRRPCAGHSNRGERSDLARGRPRRTHATCSRILGRTGSLGCTARRTS